MASRQRVYDAEFREGAVRIVRETGKTILQVAEELDINPGTLRSWVSRAKRNGSPTSDTAASPSRPAACGGTECEELERLRAEARIRIGTWIADFYNARWLHSVCGIVSPVEFERQHWAEQVLQEAA